MVCVHPPFLADSVQQHQDRSAFQVRNIEQKEFLVSREILDTVTNQLLLWVDRQEIR